MPLYKNYLEVKSDYIPVFSSEADEKEPATWKHFIPHVSMRQIILSVIRMINRAKSEDLKSIYVTGGYGTGKTFGSFVIKHLLEEDIAEAQDYFEKYPILRPLWPQFDSVRDGGKFLVVYRSGSGEITTSERLLMEVQYSIREALKKNKYEYLGAGSLQEAVYNRIADADSTFDWPKAFAKYREYFMEFNSAGEVVDRLSNNTKLTERVLRVLEQEGVGYLNTVEETKKWIEDIIQENRIKAIVFIWDEFADYFKQNQTVTTLQELAHAAAKMPFYLFLITHLSVEQFDSIDNETRKKLMDRFFDVRFEMNSVTAYQLIANAIVVNPVLRDEWESKSNTLCSMVEKAAARLQALDESVRKEDIMRLAPLHPFSAYLLSAISRQFTSSQRTLFRFLKEAPEAAGEVRYNFNWFIENHSTEDWCWLTPDILWDYFFTSENQDFDQEIRNYILHYETTMLRLENEDERRVLKCMLLFMAMFSKVKADVLRPLRSNIELAFIGTPVREKLQLILYRLIKAEILSEANVGINDAMYMIPMVFEDKEKFDKVLAEIKQEYTFEKVTEAKKEKREAAKGGEFGAKVLDFFKPTPIQEVRILNWSTALPNLRASVAKAKKDLRPYQIAVIFTLLQTEAQRANLERQIMDCGAMNERIAVVAVDTPFAGDRFEKWQHDKAKQKYASLPEIRNSNARVFAEHAAGHIDDWLKQIRAVKTKVYYKNRKYEFIGAAGFTDCMQQVIASEYPFGPESIILLEPLYVTGFGKDVALQGMGLKQSRNPYTNLVNALTEAGFWEKDDKKFSVNPDHPVNRMRGEIMKLFEKEPSVSLVQIWEKMMQPPFGLMPAPISLFLWAFLMRDLINGGYYLKDGFNTQPVYGEKLAEYLDVVIKGVGKDLYMYEISKMRQDDEDFCEMMKSIFRLNNEQAGHPAEVKKNVRRYINEVKYPLWALKYLDISSGEVGFGEGRVPEFTKIQDVVDLICQFIATESETNELELVTKIANALKDFRSGGRKFLAEFIYNRLSDGMREYIQQNAPDVLTCASRANIPFSLLMDYFRSSMNEDKWLWLEESVQEKLAYLEDEIVLLDALNTFLMSENKSLDDARKRCNNIFSASKLPWPVLKEKAGDSAKAFEKLMEFLGVEPKYFADKKMLAKLLKTHAHAMRELLKTQKDALVFYITRIMKLSVSTEDIDVIYRELDTYGLQGNLENFVSNVMREVGKLQTQVRLDRLKKAWVEMTGSKSPTEWSKDNKMPILWLSEMKDEKLHEIFDILNGKPVRYDAQSLEKLLAYLESIRNRFAILNNVDKLDEVFLQSTGVDEYAFAFRINELKDYVAKRLGVDAYAWAMRTADAARLAKEFLDELYQTSLSAEVFKKIDGMSGERAKEYLKELIKKNAIVGLNILKNDRG